MKKTLSLILAVLFILPLCVSCTTAKKATALTPAEGETIFYVAPTGDDTADGTFEAPLATLEGAKEKVRTILPNATGAVSVYFREGEYYMTTGVAFDEADSGREDVPVKYAAYPGEKARFNGGVKVDPSLITKADPDSSVTARVLDETAKAALMQADVSTLVDEYPDIFHCDRIEDHVDIMKGDWNSMALYLGDTPIIPARWPNDGVYGERDAIRFNVHQADFDYDLATGEGSELAHFYYGDEVAERLTRWSEESIGDSYLTGFLRHSYMGNRVKIRSFNTEERYIKLGPSSNGLGLSSSDNGFFENIPEEIDVPAESYVDREARIAYFYPTEDFDANDVWLSTMNEIMIVLDNVSNITFEGLEFQYSRERIFDSHHTVGITLSNCGIEHLSNSAGYFFDAKDLHVVGCKIGDLEHGAMFFSGGDRNTLESSGIIVENCEFYGFNRDWFSTMPDLSKDPCWPGSYCSEYPTAIDTYAVGTIIRNNVFHDSPHCAILPQSNDIVIEHNEFYNVCSDASDMGAIYYYNNPTFLGLSIHDNYFHEIGGQTGSCQFSIYTDCGSMGPDIYNNLFVNAAGIDQNDPIRPKGVISLAQYAHIHNNIFVNAKAIFRYGDWSAGTGIRQSDWVLFLYDRGKYAGMGSIRHFSEVDFDSDIWHAKYDGTIWGNIYDYFSFDMLAALEACPDEKSVKNKAAGISPYQTNEMDNNVLVNVDLYVNDELDRSLKLHDNFMGGADIFTDAANGDYTLTEAGLALVRESCPDFDPAPFAEVGPQ